MRLLASRTSRKADFALERLKSVLVTYPGDVDLARLLGPKEGIEVSKECPHFAVLDCGQLERSFEVEVPGSGDSRVNFLMCF